MQITRRQALAGTAAAGAAALGGRPAGAQAPLHVGFILIGPVGDFGWSTMHDQGRRRMLEVLGNRVTATQVESVAPPDFDRVATQLVRAGARLIFTTSFSYFAPTQRIAPQHPNVMWENATGTATGPNLAIYNARFYEGRYVQGVIAARKSRSKQIGYVASFPVPEVIHAINTVMRGAWSVDPQMRIRVVWVNAWFNPAREADAARALIDQGCDVICQHTDSPAPLQLAEQRGAFGFGQASDMTRFAPRAHLTSSINNWGDYYAERARLMLEGNWRPADTWGGLASGMFRLAPFTNMTPEEVSEASRIRDALAAGTLHPFDGPIFRQDGTQVIAAGQRLTDDQIRSMNYFYQGIDVAMP
ncbi:MAG: BMP family ABC transporter substrate-binding protein [Rhodovarius sp.]|nr:BMP family ABC transporter substrate-binding protein [Rhodovarius sp.]MDW8313587.1 BMP family ABC transporter substrate-binding protein [Rhodovarius sp.]